MGVLWNVLYLDDGLLIGDLEKLGKAPAYLEREILQRGLLLKRRKCALWGPAASLVPNSDDIPVISWEPDSGITL